MHSLSGIKELSAAYLYPKVILTALGLRCAKLTRKSRMDLGCWLFEVLLTRKDMAQHRLITEKKIKMLEKGWAWKEATGCMMQKEKRPSVRQGLTFQKKLL